MSTNAAIGIENEDGTITAITLHWDGYVDHAGMILTTHYTTEDKVRDLLSGGELSSIASSTDTCSYYHRDRDEDLWIEENISAAEFTALRAGCHHYLFKNNEWIHS